MEMSCIVEVTRAIIYLYIYLLSILRQKPWSRDKVMHCCDAELLFH